MKHETLQFLDQNSLLDNVMYVDMLNEYPLWHGFEWLTLMLKTMSAPISAEERNKHNDFSCFFINPDSYNKRQFDFYNSFANDCLIKLKALWPGLEAFFSFTTSTSTPWDAMDLTNFDAVDFHGGNVSSDG